MKEATWQQRVDALGRGGYRRYDERTSTQLGDLAERVLDEHGGDLRRIRPGRGGSTEDLTSALTAFTGIGPTGADIFCREVQAVWPEVSPFFDRRALENAGSLGLPRDPEQLASLAPRRVAELAAALVRAG